jgi:DNA mismatch repair protein MutL
MGKIQILPKDVVLKIAAGEVIERPASVVKELVENSIDAGATQIRIEIEDSGFKKILVSDDGVGMTKEDLEICTLPHSTSKISHHQDLYNIYTLGFRGEALNSICSVSTLTIASKTYSQDYGFKLIASDGEIVKVEPHAMNVGTNVTVENLFFNIPARKQFIKNKTYEFSQIVDILSLLALANFQVAMSFFNNGKEVFVLPKNQNLESRIEQLLGLNLAQNFVPTSIKNEAIQIHGYISKPNYSFRTTQKQILFINGRCVASSAISSTVRDIYGNLIEFRMHPAFVLNVTVSPQHLDVNIHPKKESVGFLHPEDLFFNLRKSITLSLQGNDLTYIKEGFDALKDLTVHETVAQYHTQPALFSVNKKNFLQVHNMYIVVETEKGITLVDQHAAHERIVYETLLQKYLSKMDAELVALDHVEILSLSISDKQTLLNNEAFFKQVGFLFEDFGQNKFRITHVPKVLHSRQYQQIIGDFLADLNTANFSGNVDLVDEKTKKALSYLACRSAIKTGDILSIDEAKNLLAVLDMTGSAYACPHGRPTRIDLPLTEINRFFKR